MNISKLNVLNTIQQKSIEKQNNNSQTANNEPTRNIDYRSMPIKPIDIELMTGKKSVISEEKEQTQNYNHKNEIIPTKPIDIELMTGKKQD